MGCASLVCPKARTVQGTEQVLNSQLWDSRSNLTNTCPIPMAAVPVTSFCFCPALICKQGSHSPGGRRIDFTAFLQGQQEAPTHFSLQPSHQLESPVWLFPRTEPFGRHHFSPSPKPALSSLSRFTLGNFRLCPGSSGFTHHFAQETKVTWIIT